MDRLELRRITLYPGVDDDDVTDIVILVGNFSVPTGLRVAESALSNQQVCSFSPKLLILATEVALVNFKIIINECQNYCFVIGDTLDCKTYIVKIVVLPLTYHLSNCDICYEDSCVCSIVFIFISFLVYRIRCLWG